MEYTKGEWKFKREEYIIYDVFSSIEAGDIKICYLKEPHYIPDTGDRTWYNGSVEVMKANAHLIAAAPLLYKAGMHALVSLKLWANEHPDDEVLALVITELEYAIAKAEEK